MEGVYQNQGKLTNMVFPEKYNTPGLRRNRVRKTTQIKNA